MPATTLRQDRDTLAFLATLEQSASVSRASSSGDAFNSFPFSGTANRGGYAGGKLDRFTSDWNPQNSGPNRLFAQDGNLLRRRARDLYDNNPFAQSAINAYIANVIECGIIPERDDEDWDNAWERWGGLTAHGTRECDLTRDSTIYELQALWLLEILIGGGCLIHYVTTPRRSQRIPLALELIPEERFNETLQHSGTNLKTANRIVNGVEIDHLSGRTVAYHLYQTQPDDLHFDPQQSLRLSAEHCEYGFIKERIGAKRGTTLLRSVVLWLWALGYYTDNELKASDLKSSWAYIVKTQSESSDGLLSDSATQLTDLNGNPIDHHEAGMIWRGTEGDSIEGVGPNVPGGDSIPWLLLIARSISIGCRLSYEEVFRDFTKTNMSAARFVRSQDKKRYRPMQAFAVSHFGNPTIRRFDQAAVGAMIPGFPSPSEFLTESDTLWNDQDWQFPGWESPNPKDDAQANSLKLKDGTTSRQEICASEGRSWKKTRKRLEREQRDIEDSGLMIGQGNDPSLMNNDPNAQPAEDSDQ